MDELLTVEEVARWLRVSRTTVWRWCATGKIGAVKVGRNWRLPRAEVEKFGYRPAPYSHQHDQPDAKG